MVLLVGMRVAAADMARIVILPFVTTDEELVIYGKPVADAVARGLKGVGEITVSGDAHADIVVELRVARAKGKVRVEATVRDADVGRAAARLAARPVALGDLDQAAAELARLRQKPLADAADGRKARQTQEKAAVAPPAEPLRQPDFRPAVLVYPPEGQTAVRDMLVASMARLLDSLGYRTVLAGAVGFAPPADAARAAAEAHARATIMVALHDVDYTWSGVLLARGRLHLVAVGADGRLLYNRDIETDTLVGSRGDQHDALARFVVAQALDIGRKELAGALK